MNGPRSVLARTETALDVCLPAADVAPTRLHDAMRYTTLGGGKRVRPLLVHAAGLLTGATPEALDAAAAAIEMIHVYSLVHDDMPAMDDDSMRRGKPTVHVQYDEATALLVGDALQSQAFIALSEAPVPPVRQAALLRELAFASGFARHGGRTGDRPRQRGHCARPALAREDAPDEDRRAAARGRAHGCTLRRGGAGQPRRLGSRHCGRRGGPGSGRRRAVRSRRRGAPRLPKPSRRRRSASRLERYAAAIGLGLPGRRRHPRRDRRFGHARQRPPARTKRPASRPMYR